MKERSKLNVKRKEIKLVLLEKGYKITHVFSSPCSQSNLYFVFVTNLSYHFNSDRSINAALGPYSFLPLAMFPKRFHNPIRPVLGGGGAAIVHITDGTSEVRSDMMCKGFHS